MCAISRHQSMQQTNLKLVFFGSSRFSTFVLEELEKAGYSPILKVLNAKASLPSLDELRAMKPDVFIVASFGKILPKELLDIPKFKSLNVHPSLLPTLRGPAPIQGTILGLGETGVTIIEMDAEMDHGPIVVQEKVTVEPWPDHYNTVEEKLARSGGKLLAEILPKWTEDGIIPTVQNHAQATYAKMVKKEDGLLNLGDAPEVNLRKVLAYSTWPNAHFFFNKKTGESVRVIVKDAEIRDGVFVPTRVIPAGRREMDWQDFLRGNS